MPDNKKRHVVSYEKMPLKPELAAAFAEKYPRGFADYLTDLVKYPKPDGTSFYAVTVEVPDAIYLVKINVKTMTSKTSSAGSKARKTPRTRPWPAAAPTPPTPRAKPCLTTTSPSTAAVPTTNSLSCGK